VRELVRQREHLSGFAIGTIEKYERRQRVRQGEASELLRIELASIVAPHDAAHHDHHAGGVGELDESPEGVRPRRYASTLVQIKPDGIPDLRRRPHASRRGNRSASASGSIIDRARAHRSNSGLTSTRMTNVSERPMMA
jgi:hypothetical protein